MALCNRLPSFGSVRHSFSRAIEPRQMIAGLLTLPLATCKGDFVIPSMGDTLAS